MPRRRAKGAQPPESFKAKVVLVGAPSVGKTSLVRRYVLNEFDERYLSTLGANVYKRVVPVAVLGHDVQVSMTIWDTMGEPAVADMLRDIYLDAAQGVLAVCDVTDAATVSALDPWFEATLRLAGDVPVQILMNKADLGTSEEASRVGLRMGLALVVPCYRTSAKAGDNVVAAFEALARRIVERTLVPRDGPLDDVDAGLVIDCTAAARTVEDIARLRKLPPIFAEARLERLRRREFLRVSTLELDRKGMPRFAYARTGRAFEELLAVSRA